MEAMKTVGLSMALIFIYNLGAWAGLSVGTFGTNASVIWPCSGIALAFIREFGFRMAPAVWVASFTANLLWFIDEFQLFGDWLDSPSLFVVASIIALGNMIEVVGIRMLTIYFRDIFKKPRYINPIWYPVYVSVMCLIAAYVGTSVNIIFGLQSAIVFWPMVGSWWIGDMVGVLLFFPPAVMALRAVRKKPVSYWGDILGSIQNSTDTAG